MNYDIIRSSCSYTYNNMCMGVYKFVKEQAHVVYDQYAPYSYKVMREKIKDLK